MMPVSDQRVATDLTGAVRAVRTSLNEKNFVCSLFNDAFLVTQTI
jgi:hypothetical protein